ncbi:cytochrome C assembly protein [Deltaproteobacteria bacterium Smac51]|nr:cytochrome C assembly protein [Deltaproteobacteria bacterium Smac51]
MGWDLFNYFGPAASLAWIAAGWLAVRGSKKASMLASLAGILIMGAFIAILWEVQNRPPLRTMGETRLWYSFFLASAGLWTYYRWSYSWLSAFSGLMAIVFVVINLAKPEIHSITLMPALQSPYFVPHVIAYILAYAMMGVATITALIQLRKPVPDPSLNHFLDNVVYIGFGFLMLGLLSGAAWAKEAWGHYWSWDPKETWALVTAAAYLLNIHLRLHNRFPRLTLTVLPIAFILLMITWLGVSSLPSAQGSVHVYS